jgi:hypothetical protein
VLHFVVSSASNQADWVRYIDLAIEYAACNPRQQPDSQPMSRAGGSAETPPPKKPPAPLPFSPL